MKCVSCGQELTEDVSFCPSCGHQLKAKPVDNKPKTNKSAATAFLIVLLVIFLIIASPFIKRKVDKFRDRSKVINYIAEKYNLPTKEIKIISTNKSYSSIGRFFGSFETGNYVAEYNLQYKDYNFIVEEWVVSNPDDPPVGTLEDNYAKVKYYQDNVESLRKELQEITDKYNQKCFVIIDNYSTTKKIKIFSYDIFIEQATPEMIQNLDTEVQKAIIERAKPQEFNYNYAIYIFNSEEDYNKMKNTDFTTYENKSHCELGCILPEYELLTNVLDKPQKTNGVKIEYNNYETILNSRRPDNSYVFHLENRSDKNLEIEKHRYEITKHQWYSLEFGK